MKKINQKFEEMHNYRHICVNCVYSSIDNSITEGIFSVQEINDKLYEKQCGYINKLIRRYSYIFFLNILLLLGGFSVLLWYIFEKVIFKEKIILPQNEWLATIIVIFLPILIFLFLYKILYSMGKHKKNIASNIALLILLFVLIISLIFLIPYGVKISDKDYNQEITSDNISSTNIDNTMYTDNLTVD